MSPYYFIRTLPLNRESIKKCSDWRESIRRDMDEMKHPKIYLFSGDPNDPAEGFYIPEGYNISVESWAPIPLPAVEPSIAINLALQLKQSGGGVERLVRGLVEALVHELSHWGAP